MIYESATTPSASPRRRRPRAQRSGDVLDALAHEEAAARELAADLAALIQAGAIEPFAGSGELRFAACEPDGPTR